MFLFKFILAIVLTEAITELVVKSELFYPIRRFFFKRKSSFIFNWFHSLMDCGYCFSVWAGWFVSLMYVIFSDGFVLFNNIILNWFFMGVVFHRLSNVLHYLVDVFRNWSEKG